MHSKLSMKQLQSFGQDNPFIRQRSLSTRSKQQFEFLTQRNQSLLKASGQAASLVPKAYNHNQYNQSQIRDVTNMQESGYVRSQVQKTPNNIQRQLSPSFKQPSFHPHKPKQPAFIKGKQNYSCESILELLSNQKACIEKVRQTVENDKIKVTNNFTDFKQTINNIIDDLKLSVCASIDAQFQNFVNTFRIVKIQYANYCNVKKQFWSTREGYIEKAEKNANAKTVNGQSITPHYPGMIFKGNSSNQQIDNEQLLISVIEDIKDCKKHINYVQFAQIQQKLLGPLLSTTKNLMKQVNIEYYYNPQVGHNTLKTLQQSIENEVHKMYEKIDLFTIDHLKQTITKVTTNQNKSSTQFQKQKQRAAQKLQIQRQKQFIKQRQKQKQIQRQRQRQQKRRQQQTQIKKYENYKQISPIKTKKKHNIPQQNQHIPHKFGSHKQVMNKNMHVASPLNQQQVYISQNKIDIDGVQLKAANGNNLVVEDKGSQKYFSTSNTDNFQINNKQRGVNQNDYVRENQGQNRRFSFQTKSKIIPTNKLTFNNNATKRKHSPNTPKPQTFSPSPSLTLQPTRTITDKRLTKDEDTSQTALCILSLQSNRIAVGTKNGVIKIFCVKTGTKLNQLYGHTASICSLALIADGSMIASGGDIGCCQLMIWNTKTEDMYHNFCSNHKAAITSIIDLADNKHFISGSFDCCLNIYNHRKKQLIKSINTGQKITVLSQCKSSNKNQLILSGNLNSQVCVWSISKNTFNSITGLTLVRSVNIGTYPYSIVCVRVSEALVIGKDNWVRLVDYEKGGVEQAGEIGQLSQVIPIQNNGENVCIGCFKNGNMASIDLDNLQNQGKDKRTQIIGKGCSISYSCGISKKWAIAGRPACLYLPNHNNQQETQIKVWKINSGTQRSPTSGDFEDNQEEKQAGFEYTY